MDFQYKKVSLSYWNFQKYWYHWHYITAQIIIYFNNISTPLSGSPSCPKSLFLQFLHEFGTFIGTQPIWRKINFIIRWWFQITVPPLQSKTTLLYFLLLDPSLIYSFLIQSLCNSVQVRLGVGGTRSGIWFHSRFNSVQYCTVILLAKEEGSTMICLRPARVQSRGTGEKSHSTSRLFCKQCHCITRPSLDGLPPQFCTLVRLLKTGFDRLDLKTWL